MPMERPAGWWRQPLRWGQVNLKEDDPLSLDVAFWRDYWRQTCLQGVLLNAGGGVAYYPTQVPLHRRARFLGDRDLFGELVALARELGLRILARLDPNFGHQEMQQAHPDWFLTDAQGRPRQRGQAVPMARDPQFGSHARDTLYSTCWNSPFHRQFIPDVMREVMGRYDVDGFFTNGWPPIGGGPPDLSMVCHCPHCRAAWRRRCGDQPLPDAADPADPAWRRFVEFVQDAVEEVQTQWTELTRQLRPNAVFVWNTHGSAATGLRWGKFAALADLVNDDSQGRWTMGTPIWDVGRSAKTVAAFASGRPVLRVIGVWHTHGARMRHTAKPQAELRLLLAEAVAHGQRPWWHNLGGARPEDRRWMRPVADYFQWHARCEPYLADTQGLADVGLVFSPPTHWLERWAGDPADGADATAALQGWYLALLESRCLFDLVGPWTLPDAQALARYRLLIVPSWTVLDDAAVIGLRRWAEAGGALVVGHEAMRRDAWGQARPDPGWARTLGVRRVADPPPPLQHCYLRIGTGDRGHPVLAGFADTDILPGSPHLARLEPLGATRALTTLVPTYPTAPPEKVYMDPPASAIPLVFCREQPGRSVCLALDLDAAFFRHRIPDHRRLLANAVRWAMGDAPPRVEVEGPGRLDLACWRQSRSLTVHLVNLHGSELYGGAATELLPLPAQTVRLRLPDGVAPRDVRLLRADAAPAWKLEGSTLRVEVPAVTDHEIVAVDL